MSDWLAVWTDALNDLIAKGRSANMAASELSARFHRRFTRSAVIGKAKRAGIKLKGGHGGRKGPKGGPSQRKTRPRATTPAQRPDIAIRKACTGPKLGTVTYTPRPDPRPGQVPLLDLVADGCRWPSGEGPYLFCNEPQMAGHSYCSAHHDMSTNHPHPYRVSDAVIARARRVFLPTMIKLRNEE